MKGCRAEAPSTPLRASRRYKAKSLRSPDTTRRCDLSYKMRYLRAVTEAAP
jgi:hypothetical protein